jgi:hypothetical protein
MGLQHVAVLNQNAVVPQRVDDLNQVLSERSESLAPYLAAITKAKNSSPASSTEHRLFEVLYRLVEMTELSKLKAAEMVADWNLTRRDVVLAELEEQRSWKGSGNEGAAETA